MNSNEPLSEIAQTTCHNDIHNRDSKKNIVGNIKYITAKIHINQHPCRKQIKYCNTCFTYIGIGTCRGA